MRDAADVSISVERGNTGGVWTLLRRHPPPVRCERCAFVGCEPHTRVMAEEPFEAVLGPCRSCKRRKLAARPFWWPV